VLIEPLVMIKEKFPEVELSGILEDKVDSREKLVDKTEDGDKVQIDLVEEMVVRQRKNKGDEVAGELNQEDKETDEDRMEEVNG
jgi:hypothetical protein